MKLFGIIGNPLRHSFSEKYFTDKFLREGITDAIFKPFSIESLTEFESIKALNPIGLSVTIPYKTAIIPYLDSLDPIAKDIQAVNSIKFARTASGIQLIGYNTDVYGFGQSIKPFIENQHTRALILGTGGASKAVQYVLKQIGIECLFVSRNPQGNNQVSYEQLNKYIIDSHKLIVNCTPLGMFPKIEEKPTIPYEFLNTEHLCYDLTYNPERTAFINESAKYGAITMNGWQMLNFQAEQSWQIWNS